MAIRKNEDIEVEEVKATPKKTTRKSTTTKRATKNTRPKVDLSKEVLVINMAQASFTYAAKKGNGYLDLGEYLDSDYMTIEDLQIMKNSARSVFEKGWLFVDDEEAVEFLGIKKYMNKIVLPEELENIFEMNPANLKVELANFSSSIKENIYQAMKKRYEQGELSNAHTIRAIEDSLNIDSSLSVLNV
ncbi:hypothetical protein ACFDHY_06990 [Staphylococcus hyicus]|uniref:hypothetical protein n=1 Tax=Staphylococcus hyicus TaxID=1284 RepID=UPI0005806D9E|nr:hypothetical protein [Staphylococcus hyicus]AJC95743.1 hypothetical protein SHYC_04910 [Staphylococcus hyicus]MDP4448363.1 hypothetical protein [Staphylococcus hyicus]MDP4459720.1 hypothetical protein [Staphylococcus hyicus]MDP4468715.1 hypothetical protein [Staphylococcus hyicus]RTX68379.1 hypothetical protein EKQ60_05520 [Staphylococcus hyicus]